MLKIPHGNCTQCWTEFFNKNVDIQFSAHDVFREKPSSGTLKVSYLRVGISSIRDREVKCFNDIAWVEGPDCMLSREIEKKQCCSSFQLSVYCFVSDFVLCLMLPVSLDCPLRITPSVFYSVYFLLMAVAFISRL